MASKSNGARVKERPSAEGRGLKEDPTIAALSTELEHLLIERGSLDLNSLWNRYKQKYRKLPDLQDFRQFKVQKRSELIRSIHAWDCPERKRGYASTVSQQQSRPGVALQIS